jgi:hypothetical protein
MSTTVWPSPRGAPRRRGAAPTSRTADRPDPSSASTPRADGGPPGRPSSATLGRSRARELSPVTASAVRPGRSERRVIARQQGSRPAAAQEHPKAMTGYLLTNRTRSGFSGSSSESLDGHLESPHPGRSTRGRTMAGSRVNSHHRPGLRSLRRAASCCQATRRGLTGSARSARSSRRSRMIRVSSRETCIWVTPMSSAISCCVRSSKNRM